MKTQLQPIENVVTTQHSFGVVDSKGRDVGAFIKTFTRECVVVSEDERCFTTMAPGSYFGFFPSATRAGQQFGATQDYQYFQTAETRDKAVALYLAAAQRRATRQWSK